MTNRRCAQCGTVFTPRREHARFCSPGCRVGWNRDHLTGMQDVIGQLDLDRPADPAAAFSAVAEAVWWTTIIDARLIRQYMDLYDAVLDAHQPAQQPMIEGTLAGLRFVRNQMSADEQRRFIEPPASVNNGVAVTAAWRWAHRPEPPLSVLPAHMQPWVMTRYQAYEQWLADDSVGRVFQRAGGFLNLAASRVTADTLTQLR